MQLHGQGHADGRLRRASVKTVHPASDELFRDGTIKRPNSQSLSRFPSLPVHVAPPDLLEFECSDAMEPSSSTPVPATTSSVDNGPQPAANTLEGRGADGKAIADGVDSGGPRPKASGPDHPAVHQTILESDGDEPGDGQSETELVDPGKELTAEEAVKMAEKALGKLRNYENRTSLRSISLGLELAIERLKPFTPPSK